MLKWDRVTNFSLQRGQFELVLDLLMVDTLDIRLHGLCFERDSDGGRSIFHLHIFWNWWLTIFIVFFQNLLIRIWLIDDRWLLLMMVLAILFLLGSNFFNSIINVDITHHGLQLFLSFFFVFLSERPWWIIVVVFTWRATFAHFCNWILIIIEFV